MSADAADYYSVCIMLSVELKMTSDRTWFVAGRFNCLHTTLSLLHGGLRWIAVSASPNPIQAHMVAARLWRAYITQQCNVAQSRRAR